jgi:hypothetical protein
MVNSKRLQIFPQGNSLQYISYKEKSETIKMVKTKYSTEYINNNSSKDIQLYT